MKVEKITYKSDCVFWRMLELTDSWKSGLQSKNKMPKKLYNKNNNIWVLQKGDSNMDKGVYINWNKEIPTGVKTQIKTQGFK